MWGFRNFRNMIVVQFISGFTAVLCSDLQKPDQMGLKMMLSPKRIGKKCSSWLLLEIKLEKTAVWSHVILATAQSQCVWLKSTMHLGEIHRFYLGLNLNYLIISSSKSFVCVLQIIYNNDSQKKQPKQQQIEPLLHLLWGTIFKDPSLVHPASKMGCGSSSLQVVEVGLYSPGVSLGF